MKKIATSNSRMMEIITLYDEAISILNESQKIVAIRKAKEKLQSLQNSISQFLLPIMKSKYGEPDSAFNAVLNLLYQNKSVKEHFNINWFWQKSCSNCEKHSRSKLIVKPIITLSKVNNFDPVCPTSIYSCPCKTEQEMKLIYKLLPPCLIFHFQEGAGSGKKLPSVFTIHDRTYYLSCILTLTKSIDSEVRHFITWIRDVSSNEWLECNDLNANVTFFSSEQPKFNLREVYICVYESFDDLGKVEIETEHFPEELVENSNEFIDLTSDGENTLERNNPSTSTEVKKRKYSAVNSNDFETDFGKPSPNKNICVSPNFNGIANQTAILGGLFVHRDLMEGKRETNCNSQLSHRNSDNELRDLPEKVKNESCKSQRPSRNSNSEYGDHSESSSRTLASIGNISSQLPSRNSNSEEYGDHSESSSGRLTSMDNLLSQLHSRNSFNSENSTVDNEDPSESNNSEIPSGDFVSELSQSTTDAVDTGSSSSSSSSADEKEWDEKMAEVVHKVVETTLAAFLEQIFNMNL